MDKKRILDLIKNQLIISVQSAKNEPLHDETALNALIETVVSLGGINNLRLAGARDIKNTRSRHKDVVIIGITKPDVIPSNYKELVYITPTVEDVNLIADAGADIIAFDSTLRKRPLGGKIEELINAVHNKNKIAMADIATFDEAKNAAHLGADIISTTLSGYTIETQNNPDEPDFKLLQKCVKELNIPIILEGKIWSKDDVKKAFDLGAHAVVIGSAVTRPHKIIEKFKEGILDG